MLMLTSPESTVYQMLFPHTAPSTSLREQTMCCCFSTMAACCRLRLRLTTVHHLLPNMFQLPITPPPILHLASSEQ